MRRYRIKHFELMHPDDIDRFTERRKIADPRTLRAASTPPRRMRIALAALLTAIVASCASNNQRASMDDVDDAMVITNARIYTVDAQRPWADAMAIDGDGMIVAVGTDSQVRSQLNSDVDVIDLGGRMVLPGFQDAHLHAVEAGLNARNCLLSDRADAGTYEMEVRDCSRMSEDNDWVVGSGVNMVALLATVGDPLALLDTAEPNRPVLILDDIGHGAWANSKALQAVGYDEMEEDPPGGIILRSEKTGRPSGIVLENAQHRLRDAAFPPTRANQDLAYESLLEALATLAQNGITTVSDAGGYWPQGHVQAWLRAEANDELTVRASNALYVYPDRPFAEQIADLRSRYQNDEERLVRFNHAKIYVDGILSQATGALYEPYQEELDLIPKEARGFVYFDEATLMRYARELAQAGFQLHFHATGDRGAGLALAAIEQAADSSGPHRVTHLFLVDPKDYGRFAASGTVADFQLAPSSLDPDFLEEIAELIGQRSETMLPLRSLFEAGALVTLSSDWDADEISPLLKLQTVLTRDNEGPPDLATAIEMMTINPAELLRHEDRTGTIEVGKIADLVVLDRNLFDVPVERLASVRVVATLLQGEPIYDPNGLFQD